MRQLARRHQRRAARRPTSAPPRQPLAVGVGERRGHQQRRAGGNRARGTRAWHSGRTAGGAAAAASGRQATLRSNCAAARRRSGGSRRAPPRASGVRTATWRARSTLLSATQQLSLAGRLAPAPRPRGGSGRGCGSPSGRRRRPGSRCSTCSTRLTLSKNSLQSNVEISRRLPIRLAIDACSAAWCCPSARIASSTVCPRAASAASSSRRSADAACAVLARALQQADDEGWWTSVPATAGRRRRRPRSRCASRSAAEPVRAGGRQDVARATRRCSTSASFSTLGQAQSSPIVSGVTDWNAVMNRCRRCASRRPALRADQLERQRVDPGQPGELVGGDARQPAEEGRRQVVTDVARRRRRRCGSCRAATRPPATPARRRARPRPARCRWRAARAVFGEPPQVGAAVAARPGGIESSAARRRACSSSSSMPIDSMPGERPS